MKAFSDSVIPYPQAVRGTDGQRFHEFTVADPYRWLGEARPETTAWIEAQKAVTTEFLEQLEARSIVRARLRAFQDDGWPAYAGSRGDWEFLFERASDGGRILVRRRANGERATFDPGGVEALEGLRLHPAYCAVSPGGRFLVAGLTHPGTDWTTLHLWDFDGERSLPLAVPETVHPVIAWLADESGFFYNVTRHAFGRTGTPDGVYRHNLRGDAASDHQVFSHAGVAGHAALPVLAEQAGVLLVQTLDFVTQRAGLFALPLEAPAEPRRLLEPTAAFNVLGCFEGDIVLATTLDAPNGRVLAVDRQGRGRREIVSEQPGAYLALAPHGLPSLGAVVQDALFLTYTEGATHTVRVIGLADGARRDVALPARCTVTRLTALRDAAEILLTSFSSPLRRLILPVAGGLIAVDGDSGPQVMCDTRQIWATSADGTRVPAFVVTPRGRQGPRPTLLYGYGGWSQSLTPSFRTDLAVWLSLGGTYVIANTRGGSEFGEPWHEGGRLMKKANCFDDFCAVAEELIRQGIAPPRRLAIRGLSAGGLLVTACINRRPELFAAAAVRTPLVDVLHLRAFPAGEAIARELGDAQADPATFETLRAYSPLQNVRPSAQRPAVLVVVADRDDRVPREWAFRYVAAMQATCVGPQPVLMRLVEGEGHVGWPAQVELDVMADELAFLWSAVGPECTERA